MRRTVITTTLALGLILGIPAVALAAPAPGPAHPGAVLVFPDNATARVDNAGSHITMELGSGSQHLSGITVEEAFRLGAVRI